MWDGVSTDLREGNTIHARHYGVLGNRSCPTKVTYVCEGAGLLGRGDRSDAFCEALIPRQLWLMDRAQKYLQTGHQQEVDLQQGQRELFLVLGHLGLSLCPRRAPPAQQMDRRAPKAGGGAAQVSNGNKVRLSERGK